jgi:hypothetical protein
LTTGTNVLATHDPEVPCHLVMDYPYSGVWYKIIGTGQQITATTCHETTLFDSKLFVYCAADDQCANLWCVAFDDDDCTGDNIYASTVSWCSELDKPYYVVVAGYNAQTTQGEFGLNVTLGGSCSAPPSCDIVTGACCVDSSCVATNTEYECELLEGIWYSDEDCATFTCPAPTYCATCWHNLTDDCISNVTFNTIDHDSVAEGAPCSYGDYTALSTEVARGSTHSLTVTFQSGSDTEYVRAWFDWNGDLDFEDAGEAYNVGYGISWTVSTDVTVPVDAVLGPTRMRVTERYYRYPDPCEDSWYGESEDYTVVVTTSADLDGDGDIDLDDFAMFADCLAGPAVTTPPDGCPKAQFEKADLTVDDDVDLDDFALFQKAFAG